MPTSVPNPVAYPDQGYGYEVTALDVRIAYSHTLTTAGNAGVDGRPDPHPCSHRRSGRSQRIRRQRYREGSGPGLTHSQRRERIADDTVRESRASVRRLSRSAGYEKGFRPLIL